jgi:hypothetical protein
VAAEAAAKEAAAKTKEGVKKAKDRVVESDNKEEQAK